MIKKSLLVLTGLLMSANLFAAEYQGYVRGVYLKDNGQMKVYMSSDSSTAPQCAGVFDTTQFDFTIDNANAHLASNWLPLLESARQAKLAQEGVTNLPHPATDPATIKIGYTVTSNNVCQINYVYYLHWYNL